MRQGTLLGYVAGTVTIGVHDTRTKEQLELGYQAALRLALGDALGSEVMVQVVIRPSLPDRSHDDCT